MMEGRNRSILDTSESAAQAASRSRDTRPVSLVTGGSEGIGLAIAHRLAARGHALLLVARRADVLERAAASIRDEHAVAVAVLALDLVRPDALDILDAELARLGIHVDLLVNNAAVGHSGDFAGIEPDGLDRLMALGMTVPSRLMRHVLPGMRQRRRGGILNIASLGGYVPGPYQAAYYASKSYMISLSEAVAAEVRGDGIRVTVVASGPVSTAFHARMDAERSLYRRLLPVMTPQAVARWAVRGHELGLRVVIPGFLNLFGAVALRILPHAVLVPVMALLLDPRRTSQKGAARDA
jgi:short-subunit dehydrogenase